jgi:ADP-dependent NAD(P)H-hydrate dehydratase / NAD(P)H-hydrate epimerase
MQILSAAEMAATDRRTAEEFGIGLSVLMERAGAAVAEFCLAEYPAAQKIVVLAGKGNNGGDGLVAARLLAATGRHVEVVLLGHAPEIKGEAATALARLKREAPGVSVHELTQSSDALATIRSADLLLDAVVGTGFQPPLRGLTAELRELVQHARAAVVAVDLPSGWEADSTAQNAGDTYRANAVVTFTAPKPAHVFGHLTSGPVVIADIGSPAAAVRSQGKLHWVGTAKQIAEAPREANANKGKYGHVLVIGGSYGTAGAPSMASLAALRTGAGLVTAAVPKSIVNLVGGIAPELMLAPLQERERQEAIGNREQGTEGGIVTLAALGSLESVIREKRISVAAIGPGLSTRGDASAFAREFVSSTRLPIVVDADALNAFADMASLLSGVGRVLVLTPHPGEMARLLGTSVKEIEANRVQIARQFATEHALTLVLKGWRTLIAHPDGTVAVNTSGNPAMAKGGSGDILTGIIAAMLAQYAATGEAQEVARAVEAAVFLHGLAGDFAARAMDEHTVLATDTVQHLSDAFRYRVEDEHGLTWICGVHG